MRQKILGGVLVGALFVTACAPENTFDGDDESAAEEPGGVPAGEPTAEGDSGAEGSPGAPEDEGDEDDDDVEPAIEAEDGFWRLNTLPEPVAEMVMEAPVIDTDGEVASAKLEILSLDSDGEYARMILAWLVPEQGAFLGSEELQNEPGEVLHRPYIRLVDREAGQAHWPLLTSESRFDITAPASIEDADPFEEMDPWRPRRTCICSEVTTQSSADAEAPESIELMFIDFPVPESERVEVLPGQWAEPITDVPVTEGEPFEFDPEEEELAEFEMPSINDEAPGEVYGAGAEYVASLPLQARSQSLTGVTTTIEGDTQEVSLPADVLFEFGEYDLVGEAESIIEAAAQMLNEEASGETVVIEGHTDNVSGHDVNQPLSENRAQAVAEAIEPLLDDAITIETEGHSFNRPLVPNTDVEGNEIEENQALNRRVSFRYTVVEESETVIELGEFEELDELADAEEIEASEGAVGSYVIEAPEDDQNEVDIRIDLLEAQRRDDSVVLRLGVADADADAFDDSAFGVFGGGSTDRQFGRSVYQNKTHSAPNMLNISLVDVGDEQRYFPVMFGGQGCLCSERLSTYEGLGPDAVPAFAEFELPESLEGPVVLRIPDGGHIELPDELLEQLTEGG
ncbi:OmpA family protein [Nesterenkonia muleiensis]|uniref:OmpA family protein n=1 Tax=Nesterenkonia muleiensis TaxID=2282648 RepID=UPI0013009BC2|nr:OmpA family protein [Nesterenkonia muleiensis]